MENQESNEYNWKPDENISFKQTYYWVWLVYQGKLIIAHPPQLSEVDAYRQGTELFSDKVFRVVGLMTKDRAEATRIIKARYLKMSKDLDGALRRAKHEGGSNG